MESFNISVTHNGQNHHFEVKDYMHHNGEDCKYEVFKDGQFAGSFEPGPHKVLHICKDPGILDQQILHLIAEQLEHYNL